MAYLGNRPATGENNSFRLLDDISSHVVTFNGSSSSIVSISDDTIAFTGAEHRFITGQKVTYSKGSGGTVITGLTDATAYYIIKDSPTKIKLATSESNANSGVAINLTGVGGGSAHKITLAFDGFNTKFKSSYLSGTQEPIITRAAQLVISLNGVIQQPVDSSTPSVGFGIDNVGNIIFSTAPAATDAFWGNIHSSNTVTFDISDNDIDNFTGDGSTKEFTLSKIPPDNRNVLVTLDGVVQYPDDNSNARSYKLSENILEFIAAPGNGVAIQVRHIGFAGGSSGSGGSGGVTGFYGRTGNVVLKNTDNILVNNATFSGNVSIAKTLTYMDVTNIDAVGIVTFQDDVQYNGSGAGISSAFWDKSANEFKFKDNVKLSFGDSQDLSIHHNGANSFIQDTGTGALYIDTNHMYFRKAGTGNVLAMFQSDDTVELYHSGTKRINTTSTGAVVTGILTATAFSGGTVAGSTGTFTDDIFINVRGKSFKTSDWTIFNTTSGNALSITGGASATERLRIDSSGRLLVGDFATSIQNTAYLQLKGINKSDISLYWPQDAATAGSQISWRTDGGGAATEIARIFCGQATTGADGGYMSLMTHNGTSVGERLLIKSDGDIRAGDSANTWAGDRLEVAGTKEGVLGLANYGSTASEGGNINFYRSISGTVGSDTVPTDRIGGLTFRGWSGNAYQICAGVAASTDGTWNSSGDNTDTPGKLTFSTTPDGSSACAERLRIDSSGNIGIGKTTPNIGSHTRTLTISNLGSGARTAIEVEGNTANCHGAIDFRSNGTLISAINSRGSDQLQLCTGTSGTVRAEITSAGVYVGGSAASHTAGTLWFNDTSAYASKIAQVNGSSALSFHTGQNQPEQMRLDSNGNLGIGTVTPNNYSGYGTLTLHGTIGGELDFERNGVWTADVFSNANGFYITNREANKPLILRTTGASTTEAIKIDANGHVLFRGDSGSDNYRMQLRVSSTQNEFFGSANSSTNKGFKFYSANTGGSCKFVIANDGKLGVGVTVPAQLLHIQENSSNGSFMVFTNDTTGIGGNDGCLFGINSDEGGTIWQQENSYIRFGTNDLPRVIIKASGKTEFYEEIETPQDYPTFRPKLNFDFAGTKKLDPRITYERTGPASYIDEYGHVVIVGDSEPRFDHDPDTGECLGLLIEEQTTNLAGAYGGYGSDIRSYNATLGNAPTSTVVDDITLPTGESGQVRRIQFHASGNSGGRWGATSGGNANNPYSASVWAKAVSGTPQVTIDVNDAVAVTYTLSTSKWTRMKVTGTSSNSYKFFDLMGSGAQDVYFWGWQLEENHHVSSYIPVSSISASQLRGLDRVAITDMSGGSDHDDIWNPDEGTYIIDYKPNEPAVGDGVIIGSRRGTQGSGYPWPLYRHDTANTNNFKSYDLDNGLIQMSQAWADQREVWGLTFNKTNGSITRNGTLVQTNNTNMRGLTNANSIWLGSSGTGSNQYSMYVKRFMYYRKRLTNEQLVTLTSR